MKTRILHAEVEFFQRSLSKPLQLSTGLITEVTEARATVTVRAGRTRYLATPVVELVRLGDGR